MNNPYRSHKKRGGTFRARLLRASGFKEYFLCFPEFTADTLSWYNSSYGSAYYCIYIV